MTSVNWLVKRVEGDIRNFFESEYVIREEAIRTQEGLRSEIRVLEDRCVRAEQELQGRNARIQEMEKDMQSKSMGYLDRIAQLETAAAEDGKTIVDMRNSERTLRAELEQVVAKLRQADDQLNHTDRLIQDMQEKVRIAEERRAQDERTLIDLREISTRQQSDIDSLLQQMGVLEERLRRTSMKLEIAEGQVARDEQTIGQLTEDLARSQADLDAMAVQNQQFEERCLIAENRFRALLDEVGDDVGRLRSQVDRHRHDLDVVQREPAYGQSSRSMYSPRATAHHTSYTSVHTHALSPRQKSLHGGHTSSATPNREVNVAVRTSPAAPQDVAIHLEALQGMLGRR